MYHTFPSERPMATMYAPLEKTPFTPQVIVIITNPWAMLETWRNLRYSGWEEKRMPSSPRLSWSAGTRSRRPISRESRTFRWVAMVQERFRRDC